MADEYLSAAPVALFVYNRTDHLKHTLDALSDNIGAERHGLWIFSDGAKNEHQKAHVESVRSLIRSHRINQCFKSINLIERPSNYGLAASIREGVSSILEQHESVIVLEDDVVSSPMFLGFMNKALGFYSPSKVGSVSAYQPLNKVQMTQSKDVYFTRRNCSYAWGTWREVWAQVDWSANAFQNYRTDWSQIRDFSNTGWDRNLRLTRQITKDAKSWSILFGFSLFLRGLPTVYPYVSYVVNIGHDGSGEHGAVEGAFNQVLGESRSLPNLEYFPVDGEMESMFSNLYSGGKHRALYQRLKSMVIWFRFRFVGGR